MVVLEHCLPWQWGDVCHGYCSVQVASNMTLKFQFHNLKHTVACVQNCVFVRVGYRSVSVGDYLCSRLLRLHSVPQGDK